MLIRFLEAEPHRADGQMRDPAHGPPRVELLLPVFARDARERDPPLDPEARGIAAGVAHEREYAIDGGLALRARP